MVIVIGFLCILLAVSPAVYAKDITVGGNTGWTTGFNYSGWAAGQTFNVGDRLVFNYDASHKVDEVNKNDYDSCNAGNPMSSYSPSPTTITLSAAGTRYFICPTPGHCQQQMKLAVTTASGGSPPTNSPGSPLSPPGASAPPPPSTLGASAPPPPSGGAAHGFVDGLNVGSLLVLVAWFVFMG